MSRHHLFELDCLVTVSDPLVAIASVDVGPATTPVCLSGFRVETDCLVVVGNRFVVVAFLQVAIAPDAVCQGIIWFKPDRLVTVSYSLVAIASVDVGPPRSQYASASFGSRRMASVKSAIALSQSLFLE